MFLDLSQWRPLAPEGFLNAMSILDDLRGIGDANIAWSWRAGLRGGKSIGESPGWIGELGFLH